MNEAQQALLQRFTAACEADDRVVAAFLGGSFATGTADAYSDLDIYLVTTDDAYDAFFSERQAFMQRLGQPVFLEDFNDFGFDMLLFTFADGAEGELALGRESNFDHIHGGPYKVLVDKKGLLTGKTFPLFQLTAEDQLKTLRHTIYWFWEAVSHFAAAMGREQLWTAFGSLEEMRRECLRLLRLQHDFTAEALSYFKIEKALPEEVLLPLKATFGPLETGPMLEAAHTILQVYRKTARPLASKHGIPYPADLDRVLSTRLHNLSAGIHSA
jgi:predicted nucleotidyltransferase